jgi:hypothetical protein
MFMPLVAQAGAAHSVKEAAKEVAVGKCLRVLVMTCLLLSKRLRERNESDGNAAREGRV